jgi:hypothetical protein
MPDTNLSAQSWRREELPDSVGKPWEYFERRGIGLDCRGPLTIHEASVWGQSVSVWTTSHDISSGVPGDEKPYPVTVDAGAWIGSNAVLAGCHIGECAVVAAGTVVRGQDVAPHTMVAGNPARVIARYIGGVWVYTDYVRRLE